jgi:hypothetical protein
MRRVAVRHSTQGAARRCVVLLLYVAVAVCAARVPPSVWMLC